MAKFLPGMKWKMTKNCMLLFFFRLFKESPLSGGLSDAPGPLLVYPISSINSWEWCFGMVSEGTSHWRPKTVYHEHCQVHSWRETKAQLELVHPGWVQVNLLGGGGGEAQETRLSKSDLWIVESWLCLQSNKFVKCSIPLSHDSGLWEVFHQGTLLDWLFLPSFLFLLLLGGGLS